MAELRNKHVEVESLNRLWDEQRNKYEPIEQTKNAAELHAEVDFHKLKVRNMEHEFVQLERCQSESVELKKKLESLEKQNRILEADLREANRRRD